MGRTVWVRDTDVAGALEPGAVVTASKPLSEWCLRGDDGSEPIEVGACLEVVETRPWGRAMVEELPMTVSEGWDDSYIGTGVTQAERDGNIGALIEAGIELAAQGLFEVVGL